MVAEWGCFGLVFVVCSSEGRALRVWCWLVLIVGVLFGSGVRYLHWHEPLWVDELHTSWCAVGDWFQVWDRSAVGNQTPLYFLLQNIVVDVTGDAGRGLRWPSLLSGLGLILGCGWMVARWTQSPAAVFVTAGFVAIDSNVVFYAVEARPYGILMFASILHLLLGYSRFHLVDTRSQGDANRAVPQPKNVLNRQSAIRLGWVLSGVLMVHLHLTAGLVLGLEMVVLVGGGMMPLRLIHFLVLDRELSRRWNGRDWLRLFVDVLVMGLLLVPLVPQMMEVGGRRGAWSQFVTGSWDQAVPLIRMILLMLILPGLGVLISGVWRWFAGDGQKERTTRLSPPRQVTVGVDTCLWFTCIGLGTLVLSALMTYLDVAPVMLVRYLTAALPAIAVAGGLWIGQITDPWLRLATTLLCLGGMVASEPSLKTFWQSGSWPEARIEGWEECVSVINRTAPDKWPIVLSSGLIEEQRPDADSDPELIDYLKFPLAGEYMVRGESSRVIPLGSPTRGHFPPEAIQGLGRTGGLWVVVRDHPVDSVTLWRVMALINKSLSTVQGAKFTIDRDQFGAVHLLRVRRLGTGDRLLSDEEPKRP